MVSSCCKTQTEKFSNCEEKRENTGNWMVWKTNSTECFLFIHRMPILNQLLISFIISFILPGRIHSANVSGVDFVGQNVTVEWFEFGETKGKEVNSLCFT